MKYLALILFFFSAAVVQAAVSKPPTAADFARLPEAQNLKLSPDGRSIAFVMVHNGEPALITKALDPKSSLAPGALPLNGAHLQWFEWVNDERLLVAVRMTGEEHIVRKATYTVHIPKRPFIRVFSIDRSGLHPVYFDMEPNKYGFKLSYPRLISMMEQDPKHVLLALDALEEDFGKFKVHKVNVYTGEKQLVESNRGEYSTFMADPQGILRLAAKFGVGSGTDIALYTRANEQSSFKLLQKESFLREELLRPVRFDYERSDVVLFTSAELEDENYDQDDLDLYELNIVTGEWLGEHKDPVRENTKQVIEKAFPGKRARLRSWLDDKTLDKAIYEVYADDYPPQYFLLDIANKRLDFIAAEYPHLQEAKLAKMRELTYTSRDGLTIPAYLSLPPSAEGIAKPKLPAIIFPHGGPWGRDHWGFDNYVQFFASKGYAVFQPQFRGSTGFGYEHLRAGDQQWGLAIQDDITDGVRWLVEEGIVDPEKVCIVGASFGGYAAAMGLATTPDLYRCGVSINGVLDMKRFNKEVLRYNPYNRELTNPEWGIGKISPLHLRKHIDDPLLLIYGDDDSVVNPKHSTEMHKRLKKAGGPLVRLPHGEHWRTIEANEIKVFAALDKFLDTHLSN